MTFFDCIKDLITLMDDVAKCKIRSEDLEKCHIPNCVTTTWTMSKIESQGDWTKIEGDTGIITSVFDSAIKVRNISLIFVSD